MRTKQAFINALFSLLLQVALAVSGLLVPRFFIALYGSAVNGLVSSISQFITYMSLVEAGVGAAATVALYRPLAQKDTAAVNGVLAATRNFYLRSGVLFAALVGALVLFYPYIVNNEIQDMTFIRTMVLILCVNGLVDYFFLGKYRVLLMADQRGYVLYGIQIIGTVVMTAVCIGQIRLGCSALLVKGTAALIYILRSVAAIVYAKRKYPDYRFNEKPDTAAFSQRNAALLHQIVGAIANNAAVVLLTVMVRGDALVEISVYSVYNLVAYSLSSFLNAIVNGLTPSFGQLLSVDESDTAKRSYSSYELLMFLIVFVCYVCMAVLLHPFVALYSADFTDGVNYIRPELVLLFTLAGLLQAIRLPAITMIYAAGHYKETRVRAIIEMAINLVVSIALTPFLGAAGVVIGMCASYLYRSFDIVFYSAKRFVPGTLKLSLWRLLRHTVLSVGLVLGALLIVPQTTDSWLTWLVSAAGIAAASVAVLLLSNVVFEPREMKRCFSLVGDILRPKR